MPRTKENARVYASKYREEHSAELKAKRAARSESKRDTDYRQRYGISLEEYEAMHAARGGLCDICKSPQKPGKRTKRLAVDHDHVTGNVRGLLCYKCNVGVGYLQDNPGICESAARYLRGA